MERMEMDELEEDLPEEVECPEADAIDEEVAAISKRISNLGVTSMRLRSLARQRARMHRARTARATSARWPQTNGSDAPRQRNIART